VRKQALCDESIFKRCHTVSESTFPHVSASLTSVSPLSARYLSSYYSCFLLSKQVSIIKVMAGKDLMTKSVLTLSIAAMLSIPFAARANVITGVLNFGGSAVISLGSIAFVDNTFIVNAPGSTQVGGFAALAGDTGTIQNITNPPDTTDTPLTQAFIAIPSAGADGITFTLTDLLSGIDGSAGCSDSLALPGEVCTPDTPNQSPYNLQNTSATSSSASFYIVGFETDVATGDTIGISGAFTDPSSNMSFQAILADIAAPGGTFDATFAGQIATDATPEPNSLLELMMGIGLVGISAVYRKRIKRA
jgi:hypothetical protein